MDNRTSRSMQARQRARRKHLFRSFITAAGCIALVVTIFTIICSANAAAKCDYSKKYRKSEILDANIVVIDGEINVRSEPLVTEQHYTPYAGTIAGAAGYGIDTRSVNTSYGKIKAVSLYIPVTVVYYPVDCTWDDCCGDGGDAANGPFIGIKVDDVIQLNGWEKIFPKDILEDPDGVVWMSTKTGAVQYGTIDLS